MTFLSRLAYRARQFKLALLGSRHPIPDEKLTPHLSASLLALFRSMTNSEQAHSFAVLQRLQSLGYSDPDLLTAALLHDVGKTLSPLSTLDRILVVVAKRFSPLEPSEGGLPRLAQRGGAAGSGRLTRPFITAACHPAWSADLAQKAGATQRTCDLIRRHQDANPCDDPLLLALQSADDYE